MKKIFSKYFVVAVVAVAMGCISSCKDFDDEIYMSLNKGDAALKQDLADSIAKLRNEMKDSLAVARQERVDLMTKLKNHIADAELKHQELERLIQENANADAATKRELEGKIANLKSELNDKIAAEVEKIMAEIGKIDARLATIEADYAKLSYVDGEIQKVKDMFADYYKKAEVYNKDEVDEMLSREELNKTLFGDSEGGPSEGNPIVGSIVQIINQQLYGDGGTTGTPIANLSELRELAKKADSTATANAAKIATMDSLISQIKQCTCPVLVDRVIALETKMDSIKEVCKNLEYNFNVLESRVDTLSGIEETKALAQQAQQKAEQYAKEYTDAALNAILDYVNPRFTSIEEMLAEFYTQIENHADQLLAHDASIAALNDSVNLLRSDLTSLEERVKKNEEAIASLTDRVQNVEDALKNRISGIVLQATKSPVVGYFNIPMGIKSNVLAAYYGEAMNDVYFPTIRTTNLISGEAFTEEEAALLGFSEELIAGEGEVLIDDAEGNVGTLYVTINPAEVDLTGVEFSLVNSRDEVSYVTLGELEKSEEKLTFGYTRAANGFYEAKATISATDAVNAKIRVDLEDMKGLVSELKNGLTNGNMNFANLAASIQSVVNDVADATALKASWEDKMEPYTHNVYSEYALAAMTVQPLSFQFMQNVNMQSFPGISRISNFINSTIDKINISLPKFDMDFTAPEIKKIAIKDFDELGVNCMIEMNVEYELNMSIPVEDVIIKEQEILVPGQTITVPVPEQKTTAVVNGETVEITIPAGTTTVTIDDKTVKVKEQVIEIANVPVNETLQIPVKYDMTDIIKDLYGNVTEPIEDVNAMLGDLEDFMDDVNKMLEELDAINDIEQSITDAKNGIKNELNKFLENLNNSLCNAINSINDRIQPNLLLKTEGGFAMLSQVENMPTVLEAANCVLVPTTYTGELIAPAFKKYVAVVGVKDAEGNDVTSAEIANVNTGKLNTVLAGSTTDVEFAGKSGYTYEIVYSALDYSGKYSNVRYYVTVK